MSEAAHSSFRCQAVMPLASRGIRMSWKGEVTSSFSLRRCGLAIIMVMIAWWASPNALAQQGVLAPAQQGPQSTLRSLEGPGFNTAPHLVMGMLEPRDSPSQVSLRFPQNKAATAFLHDEISHSAGPAISLNLNENGASAPLLLSLLSPAAGGAGSTDYRMHLMAGQIKPYSLLNDRRRLNPFCTNTRRTTFLGVC